MENNNINYEEVRINAAINALNALLSTSLIVFIIEFVFRKSLAKLAVQYANQLVAELKKETNN